MVKVNRSGRMGAFIKARIRMGCLMASVDIIGRTEGCTMAIIQMIKRMDMATFYGLQGINMKDFGNEVIKTEKVGLPTLRVSHE